MKTIVISIGNSDNKLTQKDWSDFVTAINAHIMSYAKIHFFGGSPNWYAWQNVCWIADINEEDIDILKKSITYTRSHFNQDSAMFIISDSEFI